MTPRWMGPLIWMALGLVNACGQPDDLANTNEPFGKRSTALMSADSGRPLTTKSDGLESLTGATVEKIIDNGSDSGKRILAVLGEGYSAADQNKFNDDVERVVRAGVFGNDFFKENENAFNVYRVNLVSTDSGVTRRVYDEHGTPDDASDDTIKSTTVRNTALQYIYSGSWAHCWLEGSSNTETLIQNAVTTYVPNVNYVVVLLNESGFGGCGGGGRQVVTSAMDWTVLAHEYGHGIGDLLDEYTTSRKYSGGPVNGPNCTTDLNRSTTKWRRFISPSTSLPTALASGMDENRDVGLFEGCDHNSTGMYRPVHNCRMRSNTPSFCPVCYTFMKNNLYSSLGHNFTKTYTGDFDGDGRTDVLIHNGQDLEIYRTSKSGDGLSLVWTANNIVQSVPPWGPLWQPQPHDQYFVADFTGDGKDDVIVFNPVDWVGPYLGLLASDGTGLRGINRYFGSIDGTFWQLAQGDEFLVGDFDGDKKPEFVLFNRSSLNLAILHGTGGGFTGVIKYTSTMPGWGNFKANDQFYIGDFDGDGKSDLYAFNGKDFLQPWFGMLKSSGTALSASKLYYQTLLGWGDMKPDDRFYIGDLDRDGKSDVYVFNGDNFAYAYLAMLRSSGTELSFIKIYSNDAPGNDVIGWGLNKHDRFVIADTNRDGTADLYAFNSADRGRNTIGTVWSTGTALNGYWNIGPIGNWTLSPSDQLLPARYDRSSGQPTLFMHTNDSFGLLRITAAGLVNDRSYSRWIYTPPYDATPTGIGFP